MSLFESTIPQMIKMLNNLKSWLSEAESYALDRSFDPENYLAARLYIDQFTLTRQVQSACDSAKGLAARVSGQTPPKHEDNEATFAELIARIDKVLAYLSGFSASDFDGWEDRIVPLPFMPGVGAKAHDYAVEFGIPNFYFHITTAYSILRHCGVKLGKRSYIGGMEIIPLTE